MLQLTFLLHRGLKGKCGLKYRLITTLRGGVEFVYLIGVFLFAKCKQNQKGRNQDDTITEFSTVM